MELSIRYTTRPLPGTRVRIVVLVIIIVAVMVAWGASGDPGTAVAAVLGAGLAGARVARALLGGARPALPGTQQRTGTARGRG
jgi:hypothetical protein